MNIPPFEIFVKNPWPGRLISLDPGGTTGYAIWDNSKLVEAGQLSTSTVKSSVPMLDGWISNLFEGTRFNQSEVLAVMEEYRVYGWKTDDHAQSTMHTSRLIGCFETLFVQKGIGYTMQGAGMAKGFCTDVKLKNWDFWQTGERHARDAIRHGAYFLCMGKPYDPEAIKL